MVTKFDDDMVDKIRRWADRLVPYSYPFVPPEEEDAINILKFKEVTVDGYHLILHFNRHDYRSHFLETFQIIGKDTPFLPFCLTCKLAQRMLGERYLSLVEILKNNRKIYCWTVVTNRDGYAIASPYKNQGETCNYEGFEYNYVYPSSVNFY